MQAETDLSLAEQFADLPADDRSSFLNGLTEEQFKQLNSDWGFFARPKQRTPPGDWFVWLILAGRGFGKTRTGAQWVQEVAEKHPGCRIALVGATAADVRDTMIEGESGILAIAAENFRPRYEPSKRRLRWPNKSRATCYSADKPRQLRGPQHHYAWADELAAWRYPDAWDQLMFGLRLGDMPRAVVTTTPRPTPIIRALVADKSTHPTRGSTYENKSNLPQKFFDKVVAKYEGTRLGRQELEAEILEDTPGALWTLAMFEKCRIAPNKVPLIRRKVVAVDPSVASDGGGDECGIGVVGIGECNCKVGTGGKVELHGFVFEDLTDGLSPEAWATVVVKAYGTHSADRVVAEVNNGGGLVEVTIRSVDGGKNVPYKAVHAAIGKRARAEPISALYEQGKIHHVGAFPNLEDECRTWTPLSGEKSPNRLDWLVWGITELMLGEGVGAFEESTAGKSLVTNWNAPRRDLGLKPPGTYDDDDMAPTSGGLTSW